MTMIGTTMAPAAKGQVLRRFLRHRLAVLSAVILGLLILFAMSASLVEALLGIDADAVDLFADTVRRLHNTCLAPMNWAGIFWSG